MVFSIVTIVPIEFYTRESAKKVISLLIQKRIISECSDTICSLFSEISPLDSKIFQIDSNYGEEIFLAFSESSISFYCDREIKNVQLNIEFIINLLKNRKDLHRSIIDNDNNSPIKQIFDLVKSITYNFNFLPKINYAFNFYLLQAEREEFAYNKDKLKILAEPSFIDLDDMLSSNAEKVNFDQSKISFEKLSEIRDVDLFGSVETYVTWATIVSIIYSQDDFLKTRNLITSLELRLQMIWNRCYSVSILIDELLDSKKSIYNIDELYWSFSKTLDDARSVLSSTYSSRASKLFEEMVITSKVAGEIDRLGLKINLLEKYLENRARKENVKYQKAFQVLLFITALASFVQIALPIPILENRQLSWLIILLVSLLGIFIILRTK